MAAMLIDDEAKKQVKNLQNTSPSPSYDLAKERDARERYFRRKALTDKSGVPDRFKAENTADARGNKWLARKADIIGQLHNGVIISMIGQRGTGKTKMACDCIYEYIDRWNTLARYMTAMDFFIKVKDAYRTNSVESELYVLKDMSRPGLLVIDEIQERGQTEWEDRLLTHVINTRYAELKDTILISNQTEQVFTAGVGTSIASRMKETGGIIVCDWPSYR